MNEKALIRKQILTKRNLLSLEYINNASQIIANTFTNKFDTQNLNNIYCYNSFGSEVRTDNLIRSLLSSNLNIALPRVDNKESSIMNFYHIRDLDKDTCLGNYGINEPAVHTEIAKFKPDIIIMPGSVFDKECHRIGYGKGYYDIYLSQINLTNTKLIAFAFDIQVLNEIPFDEYDIKPNYIITESRIIHNE